MQFCQSGPKYQQKTPSELKTSVHDEQVFGIETSGTTLTLIPFPIHMQFCIMQIGRVQRAHEQGMGTKETIQSFK